MISNYFLEANRLIGTALGANLQFGRIVYARAAHILVGGRSGKRSAVKKYLLTLWYSLTLSSALAQGTVNFYNDASSSVYLFYPMQLLPAVSPGWLTTFYFGLFTAPVGTQDYHSFTFSGLYATNTSVPGMFFGGQGVAVPGWAAGTALSYVIIGWSSEEHDFNPRWFDQYTPIALGVSGIRTGIAGGQGPNGDLPPLDLFAAPSSTAPPFGIYSAIPEPSSAALGIIGAATILLRRKNRLLL
jgi:hypothetical protein